VTAWPGFYDLNDDKEHAELGDRLKHWRGVAESYLAHPDLQAQADQDAVRREIAETDKQLELWAASRARRAEFVRRGIIR
jgi:hypothetical protein